MLSAESVEAMAQVPMEQHPVLLGRSCGDCSVCEEVLAHKLNNLSLSGVHDGTPTEDTHGVPQKDFQEITEEDEWAYAHKLAEEAMYTDDDLDADSDNALDKYHKTRAICDIHGHPSSTQHSNNLVDEPGAETWPSSEVMVQHWNEHETAPVQKRAQRVMSYGTQDSMQAPPPRWRTSDFIDTSGFEDFEDLEKDRQTNPDGRSEFYTQQWKPPRNLQNSLEQRNPIGAPPLHFHKQTTQVDPASPQGQHSTRRAQRKPATKRLSCNIHLHMQQHDFDLVPKLIGKHGWHMKEISQTGLATKARVRGKGSRHRETNGEEAPVPLMIAITSDPSDAEGFKEAMRRAMVLLQDVSQKYVAYCQERTLAYHGPFYSFGPQSEKAQMLLQEIIEEIPPASASQQDNEPLSNKHGAC